MSSLNVSIAWKNYSSATSRYRYIRCAPANKCNCQIYFILSLGVEIFEQEDAMHILEISLKVLICYFLILTNIKHRTPTCYHFMAFSHNTVSDSFSCGWLHQAVAISPWQNLLKALKLCDKALIMVVVYPLLRIHSNNSCNWSQNDLPRQPKLSSVQYSIRIFSCHFSAGEWGTDTPVKEQSSEWCHLVSSAFSSLFSLGCNPIILNESTLMASTKSPNVVL